MLAGQRFGPFEIDKELGSGAMGTVYRAIWHRDTKTEIIALKIVSLALLGNDSAIARFEREADILQQLRHPNIVRYRGSGTHKPSRTKFIAMEFVDGEPLDAILGRRGRIGWEDVVHWGKQLCAALQHSHEKGIIHRDLKPSNLMITRDNQLKLADFGIAKDQDVTALTGANSTIGTAAYMSPEQCKGARDLTAKSDLYSFGVVLYELLTARKPFFAETTVDMFLKHVGETPVRPRRLNPEIPVWLDNLIMFLLEKDRDHRPLDAATAGRLLADVEEKVKTQASAAADVANARRVDRPAADGPLDATDREAAKALRSAGKKRKKKRREAWYRRPWVGLTGAAIVFLAMAVGVYLATKPASMDDLHATVMAAGTDEGKLAAATEFLDRFGDSDDPRVAEVRTAFRSAKAARTDEILAKRYGSKFRDNAEGYDPDAYASAMLAMEAEEVGELDRAAGQWEAVLLKQPDIDPTAYTDDAAATKASLRWVADDRIAAIREGVPNLLRELHTTIADQRDYDREPKDYPADDPLGLADRALRYEQFGDRPKARSAWAELAAATADDSARRPLYLLATRHILTTTPGADDPKFGQPERERLLARTLTELQAEAKTAMADPNDRAGRRDVRNGCRRIVYLYGDDPSETVQAIVERAKALQESVPK